MIDLCQIMHNLQPRLHPGVYAFCCLQQGDLIPPTSIYHFKEDEGITVILSQEEADRLQLKVGFKADWITLEVHSDLAAVGLTAKVSTALAQAGIPCNIVAGYHHDHLFVPEGDGDKALLVLQQLQG